MNPRRNFLRLAPAASLAAAVAAPGKVFAADGNGKDFLGAWNTIHSLPFPPGSFREFLTFGEGGVVHETNSFLHTASNLDFSLFGLPNVVNGADGVGSWEPVQNGVAKVVFRKMLFDGARRNFGDFLAVGTLYSDGAAIRADWHVSVLSPEGILIVDLGPAISNGSRIR